LWRSEPRIDAALECLLAGERAGQLAFALALLVALPLAVALGRRFVLRLVHGAIPTAVARATSLWILLPAAVYAATLPLQLAARVERVAALAAVLALLAQGGVWASRAAATWFELRFRAARARGIPNAQRPSG
jgi:hypothetical protein